MLRGKTKYMLLQSEKNSNTWNKILFIWQIIHYTSILKYILFLKYEDEIHYNIELEKYILLLSSKRNLLSNKK